MARAIRFIAPIESMSGNLSGLQDLLYPTDDNSAYESPEGQVNYARNYKPRYVATYRRKDGSLGFQVKTRSAVNMTSESKQAMAVLGGVGALTGAILRSATYKAMAVAQMNVENELGAGYKSVRDFLDAKIRPALLSKSDRFIITPVGGVFANPWIYTFGTGVTVLQIPNEVLIKFFTELGTGDPFIFYVNSLPALAEDGDTFAEVLSRPIRNVLQLKQETIGAKNYIYIGDTTKNYLIKDEVYVEDSTPLEPGEKFLTTTVTPAH